MSDRLSIVQGEHTEEEPSKKVWYGKGLRFECTQCGKCCTGAPGYTWVTLDEVAAIAQFLKISLEEMMLRYVRVVGNRMSLNEHRKSYDCVFLKDKKCSIYPVRPKQCRTFPWWQSNLNSEADWKEAAKFCEGINDEAPLVPEEAIQKQLD